MNCAVHIEDMTIAYRDKPVLWDIDLDIEMGKRTAIVGPNGAGKSTLLKAVLGLITSISGSVKIFDKNIKYVYKNIAYIPQQNEVDWDFPTTVIDVVLMGRYVHLGWIKRPKKYDYDIAYNALEIMGMKEFANRQISQLSGGQKQRVFFARAIAQNADIYFMDEPLAGVDIKTEKIIMDKIKDFIDEGKTCIVVHHDLSTVPNYFDNVVLINKRIISSGTVNNVFNDENIKRTYNLGKEVYV